MARPVPTIHQNAPQPPRPARPTAPPRRPVSGALGPQNPSLPQRLQPGQLLHTGTRPHGHQHLAVPHLQHGTQRTRPQRPLRPPHHVLGRAGPHGPAQRPHLRPRQAGGSAAETGHGGPERRRRQCGSANRQGRRGPRPHDRRDL